ncbi:MAG: Ku protein [Solirubrobacteraceae bacterium]
MPMPRSLWNGTIVFGLVRVPVKLHSATESKRIAFKERHALDGGAIEHRRVCVKEGKEVPYEQIVKGYEVSCGEYVVLSKEELAVAEGPWARVVEVDHFVAEQEIDPIFYERAYYLSPGKLGEDAYRVLHAALLRSGRVGIGRFVFHNKEHLAAVRAVQDVIVMQTMRFADEIVPDSQLEIPRAAKKATKLEIDTAQLLVDQLDGSYEPDRYEDRYRDEVMAVIERKARGEAIEAPEREAVTREADLLDVLKQSIERHGKRKGGGGRTPAGGRSPRKPAAGKPAATKSSKATNAKRAPAKRGGN